MGLLLGEFCEFVVILHKGGAGVIILGHEWDAPTVLFRESLVVSLQPGLDVTSRGQESPLKDKHNMCTIKLDSPSLLLLIHSSSALLSSQELFLILTVARGSRFSPQKVGLSWLHIFSLVFLASHLCFCCIFKQNSIGYRKHKTVIPVSEKPSTDLTCFLGTFANLVLCC